MTEAGPDADCGFGVYVRTPGAGWHVEACGEPAAAAVVLNYAPPDVDAGRVLPMCARHLIEAVAEGHRLDPDSVDPEMAAALGITP